MFKRYLKKRHENTVSTKTFLTRVRIFTTLGVGFLSRARRTSIPSPLRPMQWTRVNTALSTSFTNFTSVSWKKT